MRFYEQAFHHVDLLRKRMVDDEPLIIEVHCTSSPALRQAYEEGRTGLKMLWEARVIDPQTNLILFESGVKQSKSKARIHAEGMMGLYRRLYKRTAEIQKGQPGG